MVIVVKYFCKITNYIEANGHKLSILVKYFALGSSITELHLGVPTHKLKVYEGRVGPHTPILKLTELLASLIVNQDAADREEGG